jgi:arginine N-succinyltransferase
MFVLRPARETDLEAVLGLGRESKHGLTTLRSSERIIRRRIRNSIDSFLRIESDPIAGDEYFLVLEDLETRTLVGTSAIFTKVGGFQPFYAYRVETSIHESKTLDVRKELRVLHLVTEHDGPSEIGTLFLSPRARGTGAGRLLSLGRFLLIAEYRPAFDETLIAEMRGIIDDDGRSPFWEALGRHFFDVDLPTADSMSTEDKSFIADLMPTHPIYIALLPRDAQEVIGRVHADTEPAVRLLEAEGFRDSGMVDIFEAGKVIECPRDEIRSVRESKVMRIDSLGHPRSDETGRAPYLIARRSEFRATVGEAEIRDGGVTISSEIALALEIHVGDEVRLTPLRAAAEPTAAFAPGAMHQ